MFSITLINLLYFIHDYFVIHINLYWPTEEADILNTVYAISVSYSRTCGKQTVGILGFSFFLLWGISFLLGFLAPGFHIHYFLHVALRHLTPS
jgi:hypothetical protein